MTNERKLLTLGVAMLIGLGGAAQARDGFPGQGMFDQFDTNDDGEITKAEADAVRTERFKEADADGDGFLTADELRAAAEARRNERYTRMIEAMDENDDGKLSQEELTAGRDDMFFERLDADEDGIVTRDEIEEMRGHGGPRRGDGRRWGGGDHRGDGHGPFRPRG